MAWADMGVLDVILVIVTVISWVGAAVCWAIGWSKRPKVSWLHGWGLAKAARGRPEWQASHRWLMYGVAFAAAFALCLVVIATASNGFR